MLRKHSPRLTHFLNLLNPHMIWSIIHQQQLYRMKPSVQGHPQPQSQLPTESLIQAHTTPHTPTLYQTKILKPQIFLLQGDPDTDIHYQAEDLVRHLKLSPISLQDLLNREQKRGGLLAEEISSSLQGGNTVRKEVIARIIKKQISMQGCRRYLLTDFPYSIEVFDQLKRIIGNDVEIGKVIFSHHEDKEESLAYKHKEYLEHLNKQDKVLKTSGFQSKQDHLQTIKGELHNSQIYPLAPVEVFFVSGGPGAGKGTQCTNLVKHYGFRHLSTGDLLREAIKNGSKQGLAIENCIKNGQLVSSDLLVELIKSEIARNNYSGRYLIDGFPRNVENDEVWTKLMADHVNLLGLIYMKCNEDTMEKRIIQRAKTSGRSDDNAETLKKRFKVYYNETEPIISKYNILNRVITIDAQNTPQEVFTELQFKLNERGIKPKDKVSAVHPGVLLVLGGPGSGKGTQCDNMVRHFGFKHISTGEILRNQQKRHGLHSQLIEDYLKEGKLIPSWLMVQLIRDTMLERGWDGIYLLDGFPRNLENIDVWEREIGDEVNIHHTLLFKCSYKVMEERLLFRGKTQGRIDDNPATIIKRFKTFEMETAPIITHYQLDNSNIKIDAQQEIEKVFEDIKKALVERGYKPL